MWVPGALVAERGLFKTALSPGVCLLEGQSEDGRTYLHQHIYELPGDF